MTRKKTPQKAELRRGYQDLKLQTTCYQTDRWADRDGTTSHLR